MERTCKTPMDDLRDSALSHYDEASISIHSYYSTIPQCINFYYDYKKMSIWDRIKLAFTVSRDS